jgi:hypothetical protein
MELAGIEPKAFLLNGLAFYQWRIQAERAKARPDLDKIAQDYAAGREFAKDAAPYCHSRLATAEIRVGNTDDGPLKTDSTFRIEFVDGGGAEATEDVPVSI